MMNMEKNTKNLDYKRIIEYNVTNGLGYYPRDDCSLHHSMGALRQHLSLMDGAVKYGDMYRQGFKHIISDTIAKLLARKYDPNMKPLFIDCGMDFEPIGPRKVVSVRSFDASPWISDFVERSFATPPGYVARLFPTTPAMINFKPWLDGPPGSGKSSMLNLMRKLNDETAFEMHMLSDAGLYSSGLNPQQKEVLFGAYRAIRKVIKAKDAYATDKDRSKLALAQAAAQEYLSRQGEDGLAILVHSQSKNPFVQDIAEDAETLINCKPFSTNIELKLID